ncbi:MAG: maleylpyruvate isomerase family mycothiol-dependent enzyme [Acidimicrobiales bacterium]
MEHLEHCDLLAGEVGRFAELVDSPPGSRGPFEVPVPSCPGWSIGDLTVHLGTVHRWAEHLVRARAQRRVPSREMGLAEADTSAGWLRTGGEALVATLRSADPEAAMWAWGPDHHVRFWSRRQLHETLVHRTDVELALGRSPAAEPAVAADAIDEFLVNLGSAAYFSPRVTSLRGNCEQLSFRATDEDREWSVTFQPEGFEVGGPAGSPAATVAGPALTLLLVLYRRLPVDAAGILTAGDRSLIELWWANSALE